jgi:hypothetical protein
MSFITFIYRIRKNPKTYYGKCFFDYISDNHEGLDNEVKYFLKQGLNAHRKKNKIQKIKSKIMIGILSLSSNEIIPTYSTNDEIKCFDFYKNVDGQMYINGNLI